MRRILIAGIVAESNEKDFTYLTVSNEIVGSQNNQNGKSPGDRLNIFTLETLYFGERVHGAGNEDRRGISG